MPGLILLGVNVGPLLLLVMNVVWSLALALQQRALRQLRREKLRHGDTVELDGRTHVVVAVETRLDGVTEYAFEPLGELLARTLHVGGEGRTLYEELSRAGWRPPTAEGRPTLVKS